MIEASHIALDPLIGLWALGILGLACLIVWAFYALRGGRAWLTRALALTLIFAALINPLFVKEGREPLKSTVAVIVDRSASMEVDGRTDTANTIQENIRGQLAGSDTFDLRVVETNSNAAETALVTQMTEALADTPRSQIAGTIFVTDGEVHDVPADLTPLKGFGPVHSLVVGREDEKDRRVSVASAPSYGIVGEKAVINVLAEAETSLTHVAITVNDQPPRRVPVQSGVESPIPVEIDRRGPNTIVLSIANGEDELTYANNITATTIEGIRDTLRVLLITGEPHQGGRSWRDLLKSDPMVDLVHFTILRPPYKQDATPTDELALIAFPTMELFEEKLSEFDLIIFDRYQRRGVLHLRYLDNIARYVDRGGALLIAAGEPFAGPASLHRTPLASVLPLSPTGEIEKKAFRPVISDLGERHSVTRTLNPETFGQWYRYIEARNVTGDVLMTTPEGKPLLALDRVGEGRVAELMSDQLWLWARGHDGGGPFAELIRRLVHWMMKEPELEEEYLRLSAENGEIVARLTSITDKPSPLELITPTGKAIETDWQASNDQLFEARIPAERFGIYRASSGDLSALYLYGPAHPREYENLTSTTDILEPLAVATSGSVRRTGPEGKTPEIRANDKGGAGSDWIGLRDRKAYIVRDSETKSILPSWLVAGMLFGLLLLSWRREGS